MVGSDDENTPPPPPTPTPTQQAPHTVSTIKLPLLKKGEYDIWAMKMEHYLAYIDYPIWEVIQSGNGLLSVSTDTNGVIKVLPPKTADEILARERKRKARTTLLKALPEDHLAKFHRMIDVKEMWDAIKSRFEGLHKGYDRFQSLLSQLEIHGAGIFTEDSNQKFLRVFEYDVKGSNGSSSSAQNVAFVSSKSTNSTNDISTAYGASTSSGHNSQRENSSSYTDDLMYSFFANQSSGPQLDHKDLEQLDEFDLEEMDMKWQVTLISMRLKKFYKKTGRKLQFDAKEPVGLDKTKVECYNYHKTGHFSRECRSKGNQDFRRRDRGNTRYKAKDNGRRPGNQEESKALVTLDGDGIDWTGHAEDEQENFALMAYSNSGSDTEVKSCSKACEESYAKLKILYDEQREQLGDASIEIKAYILTLAKNIKIVNEVLRDKSGLKGMENQIHEGVLSYENEVLESVFDSRSSDVEDTHVYDRFAKVERMHVVPLPMIGIYMPPKSDFGIDESNFTYGPKQSKTSEFAANTSDSVSCESNYFIETLEFLCLNRTSYNGTHNLSVKPKSKFGFDAPYHEEETVKEQNTCSPSPKADKRDWNGLMSKKLGLGYGFTKKACFNGKGTGQWENRLVWNNVQILNHQNKFVPKVVLTKTDIFPVNTARQNLSSQAAATSTARKVNTARPIINEIIPRNNFYKSHSPIRRLSSRTTTPKENFANHKVNTVRDKIVSAVGGNRETTVKASAGCNWRSKRHYWNKVSKYNSGSNSSKNDDPQKALENKGIIDSGCSRHMTGNKAYLVEYQDYNGGPVAFGRSKGQITANKTACPKEAKHSAGAQDNIDIGNSKMEVEPAQQYFVLPLWSSYTLTVKSSEAKNGDEKPNGDTDPKTNVEPKDQEDQAFLEEIERIKRQEK
ncbi:ribonuclease H-like domain-containing protein [Tanacetum coccineum]